ncbi:unnamed protein product [Rhizophagus irregularis]|uniref:Uncharacterized protein n=1 Tax=Rhizophagus irregularis TaxID=588596 RepID=A0A2I1GDP6_9GLOM|nr:hypothetical protein RhiirA4_459149 [Rhizophagus irregularis]CAB4438035.1 unnamed protein product [Rhizophagus irregularis]
MTTNITSPSMNTANYERWLKLVETNNLISVDNGKQLYQKKPKLEMVKNIYINAGMQIPGEIEKDEIEGEEETDEEE